MEKIDPQKSSGVVAGAYKIGRQFDCRPILVDIFTRRGHKLHIPQHNL
jgi:hypothetical protein